ncbi:MAG: hypothetical protein NZ750_13530 [Anaerolineae bacterium]|nr:hypothetical protein [Anaerolineae bacterium]MDW8172820.1 hypothetical protein [Anaerolineae bacterium]
MAKAQELLQQGLQALEAKDRAKARDLLTQAMEEDPNSVEIWVALSKATDDVDEKRIALASILQLDPNNAYAKAELAKAEQEKARTSEDVEIVPGITRRMARNTAVGLTLYTMLVCGLAFIVQSNIVGSYNARQAQIAQEFQAATAAVLAITESWETATQGAAETATQVALNVQATLFAQASPTPTATATRSRDLPTPIPPTATPTSFVVQITPPPSSLSGSILAWGGSVFNPEVQGFLNLLQIPARGGEPTRVNRDTVRFPTSNLSASRLVYMRALRPAWVLYLVGTNRDLGDDLAPRFAQLQVENLRQPRLSSQGNHLIFIADTPLLGSSAIFMYNLSDNRSIRLTSDIAQYQSADVNADGTLVIAAKASADGGSDLVLIRTDDEANGFRQFALTADGGVTVEAFPRFGPDSAQIIFQAHRGNPSDNDLYAGRLLGSSDPNIGFSLAGGAQLFYQTPNDEIYPVFSPNGRHVAFASNRSGVYNIHIIDFNDRSLVYQLTSEVQPVYPADWTN